MFFHNAPILGVMEANCNIAWLQQQNINVEKPSWCGEIFFHLGTL